MAKYCSIGVPLAYVTIIFYLVGLGMFLLPPVPGVPVYLFGGVMLVRQAEVSWGGGEDAFWPACAFTVAICFTIKLNAVVVQQKVFGERLGKYVSVRKLVGVNSTSIRAIRKILDKPGLSIAKVAILCGGPDWPTSVLTGILRLSVARCIFGSLPVIFLVTPTVLAGALQLKKDDNSLYASLNSIFLGLAAGAQSIGLFAATYYVEDVRAQYYDELCAEKADEEVLELEKREKKKMERYMEESVERSTVHDEGESAPGNFLHGSILLHVWIFWFHVF